MNGYITPLEAVEKWNITERQVQILCKKGKIPGAVKLSRIWIIPEDAQKPVDGRRTKSHNESINREVDAGE